ncbi:flavoprotein [Thermobaculum terrenum]|uniref:flavoprotein n=1 Tax=Thermobaculum terrenum TaxID=166501 RepID=UPI00019BF28D|nr:flavoprotein [Thermobaculum terrenum]
MSTAILSYPRPIVFAPAMNQIMWNNPAFQRNKKRLEEDGHRVVQVIPTVELATGQYEGYAPSTEDLILQLASLRMSQLSTKRPDTALGRNPVAKPQQGPQ